MKFEEVKQKGEKYLFQNYGRLDIAFEYGKGMYLYDDSGKEYLDLVAGIAVNVLGYAHPKWTAAMQEQVGKLVHVSNLYHIKEQALAAEAVASVAPKGLDRVLFVNSGTRHRQKEGPLRAQLLPRTHRGIPGSHRPDEVPGHLPAADEP